MQDYRKLPVEELLQICKNKMRSGRTYDEMRYFLDFHKIDAETQKYIFTQLEAFEVELANEPKPKKKRTFSALNLVYGTLLLLGAMIFVLSGLATGTFYYIALLMAIAGIVFIFFEMIKSISNGLNND